MGFQGFITAWDLFFLFFKTKTGRRHHKNQNHATLRVGSTAPLCSNSSAGEGLDGNS